MKVNHTYRLQPDHLKIDDRSTADLILYIKELSKKLHYFNSNNEVDETWNDLLKYDPTFLLAEIHTYPISTFGLKRLSCIKNFDQVSKTSEKWNAYNDFFRITMDLFELVNGWYHKSRKNNLTLKSSPIEYELEVFITKKLSGLLSQFKVQFEMFYIKRNPELTAQDYFNEFSSLWSSSEIITDRETKMSPNYAMKKLILLFNSTYEIVYNLIKNAEILFNNSLNNNQNHKAHTGLIFTFFKLFETVQLDINAISKKHLDLFYRELLHQEPQDVTPSTLYSVVEINNAIEELNLSKGQLIKAGQYKDGKDILFQTTEDLQLNNIVLSHLSTTFLSRTKTFEYHSRFNLVSGIFTKIHATSFPEVLEFNKNNASFSSLGEEQKFRTETEMNMDYADVGFIIASPSLQMGVSNRKVVIEISFDANSINYLSDLLIDIASKRKVNEELIFSEIFDNAFLLSYTAPEGWQTVERFEVVAPQDWTTGKISIQFQLNKKHEAFSTVNKVVHGVVINTPYPVLKFTINQQNFYNAYSFLNGMKIDQIDIKTEVSGLKNLQLLTNSDVVDPNSSFEMFGARPRVGSYLLIGSHELFNKNIDEISLSWDFENLPVEHDDFKSYYKDYPQKIDNRSFKLRLSALSDFEYKNAQPKEMIFDVFNQDENNNLLKSQSYSGVKLEGLDIIPDYQLQETTLKNYTNDLETGFLKLELVTPKTGFGFSNYNSVYANTITNNALKKTKKGEPVKIELPNEPFSPEINNLSVGYKSSTSIIFNQKNFTQNNFSEDNSFHLISPYGVVDTFKNRTIHDDSIVYNLQFEGELVIGFSNCKVPRTINLLFEIVKSESTNYEFSRKIEWFYFSAEGWKTLPTENLMYDQTQNLMRTGVLSLKVPTDIATDSSLFKKNKSYFKVCSKSKSDQFSLIKSIRTNALSAIEIINDHPTNRITVLPPNSVSGFVENIKGLVSVKQPLQTIPGRKKENEIQFYSRVSELIRHKNRPITKWDFEKYVLHNFPWLSHTNCFSTQDHGDGNIRLLCIKRIDSFQNIDEIRLSASEMQEIERFVKKVSSPFAQVKVINPVFEDLWLKCKVIFKDISNGNGIEALTRDLFNFLCPWLRNDKATYNLGTKIKLIDIVNFVKSQSYIEFVTSISVVHLKKTGDDKIEAYDSALENFENEYITCGSPWSIIVPKGNHRIEIAQNKEFSAPEPMDFNDLGISSTFLVNKDSEPEIKKERNIDTVEKEISFKLKL